MEKAGVYSWLRGYEQYYIDLALSQQWVAYMLDRLVLFSFIKRQAPVKVFYHVWGVRYL